MTKNSKIIAVVVLSLAAIVAVLAFLNWRQMNERLEYHVEGSFRVVFGEEAFSVSIEDLINLETNDIAPSPRGNTQYFTGVSLVNILRHLNIDYSNAEVVQFFSIDGFATAIELDEALADGQAYIVFEEDNEALGLRDGNWADAPFMLVMAEDPFPNRWARYIIEIVIN